MQGHRNDKRQLRSKIRCKIGDRFAQHTAQNFRCGKNMVVLQKMDQLANSALVAAIGGRLLERRTFRQTLTAERLCESGKEALTAKQAALTTEGFKGFETLRTDREQRMGGERKFAKAAIGGKQQRYYAIKRSARNATYYRASSSEESFPDPSSISGTAEDEPPENKLSIARGCCRAQRM